MMNLNFKIIFLCVIICIHTIHGADNGTCYGKLGCFSQDAPWVTQGRPLPPPESPEKINITLTYYSRKTKEGIAFKIYPETTFKKPSTYKGGSRAVVIVHGFASSANASWVTEMKDTYIDARDVNVYTVNWENGASATNYLQAASNTRVVGAALGLWGTDLIKNYSSSVRNFHFVGHSLGAHISGYAAKSMNSRVRNNAGKVNRITGMDPAQPGFQDEDKKVRLDKDDAKFVEVIHSDAKPFIPTSGFGYLTDLGHADFYLNNGFMQPGCNDVPLKDINSVADLGEIAVETISKAVSCNHGRAYVIFTAALSRKTPCKFIGHRITSRTPTITSDQSTCGNNGTDCLRLEINTNQSGRGAFQIYTGSEKPYCCKNFNEQTRMCMGDTTTPAVTTPAVTTPSADVTTPGAGGAVGK